MSVKIKRDALQEFLKNTLFEMDNVQYGMYDRPGASSKEQEGDTAETTIPEEVPVQPAEMMATQLADERPPIEDDEFVPNNVEELGRAVKAMSGQVPSDRVAQFYKDVQRAVEKSVGDSEPHKVPDSEGLLGDKPKEDDIVEETIRRAIRLVLKESSWGDDDDFRYQKSNEPDYAAMDDPPPNNEPDGQGLDQIASEFGYAGASGARQDIERMLRRMRYISEKMGKGDMEALQDFAVQEFADALLAGEYIDADDVTELQQNVGMVKGLDSFRFFFVGGIMMPAYNEIKRNARKKVEEKIASLGLPQGMSQSILNQALGEVPKNLDKLESKLLKLSLKAGIEDSDELDSMVDKMRDAFPDLEKSAELEGGLLDLAKERWGKQSKGRRLKALAQALQSTSDWQELDQ